MLEGSSFFADAEASYATAKAVVFGVPFDATSSFRKGAAQAPGAIREAGWNFETFDVLSGLDLSKVSVHDYGDLPATESSSEMINNVQTFMASLLQKNKFPLCLGGDHSVTIGCVREFPKDTMVVSLDAHLDYRDSYEDNPCNHACVMRRISEHVGVENMIVLGVRSAEYDEWMRAKQDGVSVITSQVVTRNGISHALRSLQKKIQGNPVYLTIDIDVLDPMFAPGTSTPEPHGLTPDHIWKCVAMLAPSLIGADIVEVCPPYDKGETALLAAKLARYILGLVFKST